MEPDTERTSPLRTERREISTGGVPTGWVALAPKRWTFGLGAPAFWVILPIILVGNVADFLASDLSTAMRIVVRLGAIAVAALALVLWVRFRPGPQANFGTSEVQIGRRTIPMRDIRWARLLVVESSKSRSIALQFGPGQLRVNSEFRSLRRASYIVRTAHGTTPPEEFAERVAEMLRRSGIELPQTPEDPTGRFTWFNFPGAITREQAIDIVSNPPAFGDPIPVPPSHMFDPKRPRSARPTNK